MRYLGFFLEKSDTYRAFSCTENRSKLQMRLIEIKRCNLMNHVHHSIYLQEVLHTTIYTYYILSRIPNPNSKAHCKCLLSHALHLRLDLTSNHVATNVPVNGNPRARHPKKNPREKKHPRLFLSGVLFRDSLVVNENNPKGEFFLKTMDETYFQG